MKAKTRQSISRAKGSGGARAASITSRSGSTPARSSSSGGGGQGARQLTNMVYQRLWQNSQESLAMQGELAQAQLGLSREQVDLMEDQWNLYKKTYSGTEKKWANAARAGIPTDYYTARAGQDVNRSFDQSKQRYARELQRMGIDPSSPRFAAILADVDIAQAAALAGAKTNARAAINDSNYARLGEVGKTGRGIPSEASSMLSAASQSVGAASNAYQAGYGDVNGALNALGNVALGRENAYNQTQLQQSMNSTARTTALYGAVGSVAGTATGAMIGRMCWVARAVYGIENHKWLEFRDWMLNRAPAWFRALYLRHGPAVAEWISDKPVVKSAVRTWMDWIIKRDHKRVREPAFA